MPFFDIRIIVLAIVMAIAIMTWRVTVVVVDHYNPRIEVDYSHSPTGFFAPHKRKELR